MQKKLLIISAVLVFLSTILYAFILIRSSKTPVSEEPLTPATQNNGPLIGQSPNQTAPLFVDLNPELKARINALIPTWNNLGYEQYSVMDVPKLEAPSMIPDYSINYNAASQVFTVILYRDPLLENRQKAAESLAQLLQIPKEELCNLNAQVYIPQSVNVNYADRNLGFSFCPGSTDLKGVSADQGISNVDPDNPEGTSPDIQL